MTPERKIYFIGTADGAFVKIGHTASLSRRLDSLRNGSPSELRIIATLHGGERAESRLHRRFAHCRERGEWFRYTSELRAFVESLPVLPIPARCSSSTTLRKEDLPILIRCNGEYIPTEDANLEQLRAFKSWYDSRLKVLLKRTEKFKKTARELDRLIRILALHARQAPTITVKEALLRRHMRKELRQFKRDL